MTLPPARRFACHSRLPGGPGLCWVHDWPWPWWVWFGYVHMFVVRVLCVECCMIDRRYEGKGKWGERRWCFAARGRRSVGVCGCVHLRRVLADRLVSVRRPAVLCRPLLGRSFLSPSCLGICTADYVSVRFCFWKWKYMVPGSRLAFPADAASLLTYICAGEGICNLAGCVM